MKYIKLILVASLIISFFISCEENFSPKTDFKEEYILYSVINGDTTFQTAILMKNYNVEGFDPYTNSTDPQITGAKIKIYYKDQIIELRDTSVADAHQWRYDTPFNFYYTDNFQPDENEEIRIEAELPNGDKISAVTVTPESKRVQFVFGSDRDVPTDDGTIDIHWQLIDASSLGQIYLPQMKIIYFTDVDGIETRFEKDVPLDYIFSNNQFIANYPQPSARNFLSFKMTAFERALAEIAGDNERINYKIDNAVFELLILDDNLIPYYLTTETFLDGFTIIVDELEYTNVQGGLGVFGSFFLERGIKIFIDKEYLLTMGFSVKR